MMKHGKPQILSQINIKQHIQKETAQSQYPMPEKVRFNLQPAFSHSLGQLRTLRLKPSMPKLKQNSVY